VRDSADHLSEKVDNKAKNRWRRKIKGLTGLQTTASGTTGQWETKHLQLAIPG
jgi:hypothetical protein